MTTEDIALMGPHARASYTSRMQALKEYGINPNAIHISDDNHYVAQAARHKRERILHSSTDSIIF